MNTLKINGATLHYESTHDIFTWETRFGDDEDLWDFSADDIITGAVTPDNNIVYWYISGRFYETTLIV